MPDAPLSLDAVTPQQAGWDATVDGNFDAIESHVNGPIRMPVYTVGTLPSAADHGSAAGWSVAFVSDPAGGKTRAVYSDGTDWRYVGDDTVV